jgi:hypothetical protein
MHNIVLDQELRSRLNGLNKTLNVCEPDGTVVGRFVPESEYRSLLQKRADDACPLSSEELNRRAQVARSKGGTPLQKIWKDLGAKP